MFEYNIGRAQILLGQKNKTEPDHTHPSEPVCNTRPTRQTELTRPETAFCNRFGWLFSGGFFLSTPTKHHCYSSDDNVL